MSRLKDELEAILKFGPATDVHRETPEDHYRLALERVEKRVRELEAENAMLSARCELLDRTLNRTVRIIEVGPKAAGVIVSLRSE